MTGVVCLQGGAEFGPDCREMDADLLRRAGGPVVVTALAGAVGLAPALTVFLGLAAVGAVLAARLPAAP